MPPPVTSPVADDSTSTHLVLGAKLPSNINSASTNSLSASCFSFLFPPSVTCILPFPRCLGQHYAKRNLASWTLEWAPCRPTRRCPLLPLLKLQALPPLLLRRISQLLSPHPLYSSRGVALRREPRVAHHPPHGTINTARSSIRAPNVLDRPTRMPLLSR